MTMASVDIAEVNDLSCKDAARWYLDHGLRPIPWEPGEKGGKKAAIANFSYRQYATAPASFLERLLGQWQDVWQVGIALAEPGGIFAIDVDSYTELNEFEDEHGRLPDETWRQSTGRPDGGEHFLLRRGSLLNEWPRHGVFSAKYPHLEVKSNGFIAVPPSKHPSGNIYRWREGCPSQPAEVGIVLASWLNQRQQERGWNFSNGENGSPGGAAPDLAGLLSGGIPPGMPQDNTLRDAVWVLIQRGHSDGEIKALWDTIVSKSPILRAGDPWTDQDFQRHLRGAREKLGAGTASASLAWATSAKLGVPLSPAPRAIAPLASGARAGEPDYDLAPLPEEHAITETLAAMLVRRRDNGNVNLSLTHEELPRSDLTSAAFLMRLYGGFFTYSTQNKLWRRWDGVSHTAAEDANVPMAIQEYAFAYKQAMREVQAAVIADRIATGDTPEEAEDAYRTMWKKHRSYRDELFNNGCQVRVLRQMETKCAVNESHFDNNKFAAPCDNGVVIWQPSGVILEPHDKARLVTKRLGEGVRYDPDAESPVFDAFLESSVPDENQRKWLQVELGAALFGQPWKGFINFIGKTNSGKSTCLRLMQRVFGTYACPIGIDAFIEGSKGNNEFRLHELKGARLVMASEPAPGRKIDAESVKALTGGDPQKTRTPYGQYVMWQPQCTIIIGSNQPMRLETSDVAMLNRIGPIAFSNAHAINPKLEEELAEELPGVLNWLIEGANQFAANGHMELPPSMRNLREMMAEAVDDVLQFVRETLDAGIVLEDLQAPHSKCVATGDYYSKYTIWCMTEGIRTPVGKKTFTQRVDRRYTRTRSNNSRFSGLVPGPSW